MAQLIGPKTGVMIGEKVPVVVALGGGKGPPGFGTYPADDDESERLNAEGKGIKANCLHCGEPGHMKQDCPQLKRQNSHTKAKEKAKENAKAEMERDVSKEATAKEIVSIAGSRDTSPEIVE